MTASVNVLQEILTWSKDRPNWQRDALRRLVINGELTDADIRELADISKSDYGLAERKTAVQLASEHVPAASATALAVSLESIYHHRGVNALAEGQTLKFAPGLTVVYGDNGAGKTGYTRILKRACRARGREEILGNMVSGVAPPTLDVAIKYKVGAEIEARTWTGGDPDEFVSRVSVFDTQCAAVYLNDKTDVAFLPFGLDLFDKLVKACRAVKSALEADQRSLNASLVTGIIPLIPDGTQAAKFVAGISSLTKPESVIGVTRLNAEEEARRVFLDKALKDLQANDPQKLIRQLTVLSSRVRALVDHLRGQETALSDDAVSAAFAIRADGLRKSEEAKRLREATFPEGMLPGTGGDPWKALWEAAREFSPEAYPAKPFPVVEDGAKCLLCQQGLDHAAVHRLRRFEEFVTSTTERELQALRDEFRNRRNAFAALKTSTEAVGEAIAELRIEHGAAAEAVAVAVAQNEKRRLAIVKALTEHADLAADCPALVVVSPEASRVAVEIEARLKSLREAAAEDKQKSMAAELRELDARLLLGKHEQTILDEIERKKKVAAFGQCLDETRPTAITAKGSSVTKTVVSERLKTKFRKELAGLNFTHVEVELKEAGGSEGVFYHRLSLTRAPGVDLPKVVSEGEQRCLSIAAFFAELSTADDPSGIVFDDPVSSLDFRWRLNVAARLVEESKVRQVIVFTHDIVFLLALHQSAKELGVGHLDQHVRHTSKGAGVCVEELPWPAMKVSTRIGYLKNQYQAAEKLHRNGQQELYEKEAKYLYGLLREAWERCVEEELLGGVVERFRSSVETRRIKALAAVSLEDCKTVEKGMTKCSKWLRGHDHAAADRAPVPGPAELKADIDELEKLVAALRTRQK